MPPSGKEKDSHLPEVFVSTQVQSCTGCGKELLPGALVRVKDKKTALCTLCEGIGELSVLRSGVGELTRMVTASSRKVYAIKAWSTAYEKYQRIGILAERELIVSMAELLQDKLQNAMECPIAAADARFDAAPPPTYI